MRTCSMFGRKFNFMQYSFRILLINAALAALPFSAFGGPPDIAKIEELTGLKGTMNDTEGVFKITQARDDVKVSVDGWQMPGFMGLTSWAAFTAGKKTPAMVMGDRKSVV